MSSIATPEIREKIKQINRDVRANFYLATERVLKIKPKDAPLAPFILRWPQRYIVERYLQPAFDRKEPLALLILKARQDGISTLSMGWTYHKVRWYPGVTSIVAAHQDDTVASLHDMAKRFHENLPRELQPPTDRMNRKELHYLAPLDSSLRVRAGKYLDISRGKTPQIVVLSELPYYPDPETIMSGVTEAVPDYGPTLILMEGTAIGIDSWHYDLWQDIGRRKRRQQFGRRQWERAFLPWFWSPDKASPMPGKGWDFPEKEERKRFRGIQKRFNLRDEQIMWYWIKYQDFKSTHQSGAWKELQREHPSTAEDAFVAGGDCIFDEASMDQLKGQRRPPILGFNLIQTGTFQWTMVQENLADEPACLVWEEPKEGYEYGIGVDVSRGVGRDDSAVVVTRMPGFKQVAHWNDNHTSTRDLAYITARIAMYYAAKGAIPICAVELNDAGLHTNLELGELASTLPLQLYIWEYLDRLGATPVDHRSRTGWITNASTKPIMIGVSNSLLLAGQCEVPSAPLQLDISRCQEIVPGRYKTGGRDLAVAWLLSLITCWRKIARFGFNGYETLGQPKLQTENPYARIPDVFKDVRWQHHIRREDNVGVTVGNQAVDWLVQ